MCQEIKEIMEIVFYRRKGLRIHGLDQKAGFGRFLGPDTAFRLNPTNTG